MECKIPPKKDFYDAMFKVVFNQGKMYDWNPWKPTTFIANETLQCVRSYLPAKVALSAGLFCALGSVLDFHYGIDCFFMLKNGKFVTIDLSVSRHKANLLADVLLSKPMAGTCLWRVARMIAARMML